MGKIKFLKPAVLCLLFFINIAAIAQKLPSVQDISLLAPRIVKIDGKTNEWGSEFKAYNKSTSIFYTLANDNNSLYLIVQATQTDIIEKIVGGGVTFKIENLIKSKASVPFSITYPLIPVMNRAHILSSISDTAKLKTNTLIDLNKELAANSKDIKIGGSTAIPDSLISIYNPYGIKASILFNSNKTYTYELAVPLKYFSHMVNSNGDLNYTIQLNGIKKKSISARVNGKEVSDGAASPELALILEKLAPPGSSLSNYLLDLTVPTNLSGPYKLAK